MLEQKICSYINRTNFSLSFSLSVSLFFLSVSLSLTHTHTHTSTIPPTHSPTPPILIKLPLQFFSGVLVHQIILNILKTVNAFLRTISTNSTRLWITCKSTEITQNY